MTISNRFYYRTFLNSSKTELIASGLLLKTAKLIEEN